MSFISDLRIAITQTVAAKETGAVSAGNLWVSYVRATMLHNAPSTTDAFDARHNSVIMDLEAIQPLSKAEKNSLSSAKCVIKKAVERGLDVWKRDEDGHFVPDDEGNPLPRGKSDLQDDKGLFEVLMKAVRSMEKKLTSDDAEPLTTDQRTEWAAAMLAAIAAAGIETK